jgi:hypothetical protein
MAISSDSSSGGSPSGSPGTAQTTPAQATHTTSFTTVWESDVLFVQAIHNFPTNVASEVLRVRPEAAHLGFPSQQQSPLTKLPILSQAEWRSIFHVASWDQGWSNVYSTYTEHGQGLLVAIDKDMYASQGNQGSYRYIFIPMHAVLGRMDALPVWKYVVKETERRAAEHSASSKAYEARKEGVRMDVMTDSIRGVLPLW